MPASPTSAIAPGSALVPTARVTGLFYLLLGVTGMLGFLVVRPALFVADDPAGTLARLVDHEQLARAGIALEMATVLAQTLAALWFYRLFRSIDTFAAGSVAVFGLFNAAAIMTSAALLATALQSALGPLAAGQGPQLFYLASANAWNVGNLFFGLWLIPMGWCVLRSGWMPKSLGWILIAGGPGYVLNAFVSYLAPHAGPATALLVVPATIGEFWMIGYLLIYGIRGDTTSAR